MTNAIETKESRLYYCEQTIARGQNTFIEVGEALAEIMESQLYKLKGFGSFAEYTEKVWGFKKTYAYQLVNSSKAAASVSAIAENLNEAQARELAKVAPEKRVEVLRAAGNKPTARKIRKAAVVDVEPIRCTPKEDNEAEAAATHPALAGIDLSKLDGAEPVAISPAASRLLEMCELTIENMRYVMAQINEGEKVDCAELADIKEQFKQTAKAFEKWQAEVCA